jgi:hypothetical protein
MNSNVAGRSSGYFTPITKNEANAMPRATSGDSMLLDTTVWSMANIYVLPVNKEEPDKPTMKLQYQLKLKSNAAPAQE